MSALVGVTYRPMTLSATVEESYKIAGFKKGDEFSIFSLFL